MIKSKTSLAYLVYGMGKSGISIAKNLKKLHAKVICWDDDSKIRKKLNNKNFIFQKFWNRNIDFKKIFVSPGINIYKGKLKNFFKKNLNKVNTDFDLFFKNGNFDKTISVTGTNGKSTTCKIIFHIFKKANLKVQLGGNIGNPILNLYKQKNKINILEVSSYQLDYSRAFRSKHSILLNISPDHLERHRNVDTYIKTKLKIFQAQQKKDYAYINVSDLYYKKIYKLFKSFRFLPRLVKVKKNQFNYIILKIKNNYLKNSGNIENVIFAIHVAKKFKIKDSVILSALNSFKGLPYRQQKIYKNRKFQIINDSKSTSFHSSISSLKSYPNIYWIVGGLPKLKDKLEFKHTKKNLIKAYIVGKKTSFYYKLFKNKINFQVSHTINKAIDEIFEEIKTQKKFSTILFSPSGASFDYFKNFEERGDFFQKIVNKKLKNKNV